MRGTRIISAAQQSRMQPDNPRARTTLRNSRKTPGADLAAASPCVCGWGREGGGRCRACPLPPASSPHQVAGKKVMNYTRKFITFEGSNMPTHKPRLTITLPPHIEEVVTRLADLQGRSRSAVIVDVLEAVHRPWLRSCALLEAAREAPGEVTREVMDAIERETRQLESAFQTIDMFGCWGQECHQSDPPLVTRGSGTENQGVTKGRQGG